MDTKPGEAHTALVMFGEDLSGVFARTSVVSSGTSAATTRPIQAAKETPEP
jgi:hypothetical protein